MDGESFSAPYSPPACLLLTVCFLFQVLFDVMDPEDIMLCLLSLLYRVDPSVSESWSVKHKQSLIVINSKEYCNQSSSEYKDFLFLVGHTDPFEEVTLCFGKLRAAHFLWTK